MQLQLSHKATQFLWATIKILIVVLAGYFIYSKLDRYSLASLRYQLFDNKSLSLYLYIPIILLFTIGNWYLESKKWQILVKQISELSFRESVRQVTTAHLAGFITPAKAGDYGAKALYYAPEIRKKVLFLNFIGNMYQLLATLVFGFLGLGIIALFTGGTAIFFWGLTIFMTYIGYQLLPKLLRKFKWTLQGNPWHKIKQFHTSISKKIKKKARLLSFLRYVLFAHQFYLLLYVLGSDLHYVFTMSCIGAMYALSSLIPVMQLLDVVVRGGIAVWVFSWFKVDQEIVLATVLIMWILNVVLPLLPGAYFLVLTKTPKVAKTDV